ncbi:MAG TPA: transketolase, partial [Armatimonadota bacterium]
SIEGSTQIAFTEYVSKRFESYGWFVQEIDGQNIDEIDAAITAAKAQSDRPSLIRAHCHIGYGSPHKQDTAEAHGEALGPEEVKATKINLGWPLEPDFLVPPEVLSHLRSFGSRGQQLEERWNSGLRDWGEEFPDLLEEWNSRAQGKLPDGWEKNLPVIGSPGEEMATREASGRVMNAIAPALPFLIGGSADLAPSTKTYLKGFGDFTATEAGRNLHFGVREHAMGAVLNGMALTKPIIPFGATFLVFSDYMRPAIRIGALSCQHVIYVFTHDSIFLGEDGPTHQPVEHLASLRAMPNLTVIRPADGSETTVAWKVALERNSPVALILTRQKLPILDRTKYPAVENLERGAYTLWQPADRDPDIIIMATGSEVHTALDGAEILFGEGLNPRVVNMPCWELFEEQPQEYRDSVLPPHILPRLAIEAASPFGWEKWTGTCGSVIGLTRFGASAPYKELETLFGFTPENVAARAKEIIERISGMQEINKCV